MDETKILLDMHKLLLKDIERMKEHEPKVNMKWLKFMFKKMPLLFPIILNSYFNAMIAHGLNRLMPF